jgi:hypothetical protein
MSTLPNQDTLGQAITYSITYYFPIIGPRGLWDAWVYVFTGLAVCLFLALVSILKLQRQ